MSYCAVDNKECKGKCKEARNSKTTCPAECSFIKRATIEYGYEKKKVRETTVKKPDRNKAWDY